MRKASVLIALIAFILPVFAVAQAKKMDPFDLHVASLRVLEQKDVQAELGVTPAQRTQMDKYADNYNTHLNLYLAALKKQGKTNEPMPDETVIMMLGELKQNVMGVLTPPQLKRLREISLQAFGLNGILDTTVARKVGLSEDQISRMKKTYEDGSKKANDLMKKAMDPVNKKYKGKKGDQARGEYINEGKSAMDRVMPQVQKINDATQSAMLAIFTPQQKQNYLNLQGKVFHSKNIRK